MLTDVVDTQLVDVVTHINSDDYDVMSSFCREPISIMLFDVFDGRFPHETGLGYCFSFSHTHHTVMATVLSLLVCSVIDLVFTLQCFISIPAFHFTLETKTVLAVCQFAAVLRHNSLYTGSVCV